MKYSKAIIALALLSAAPKAALAGSLIAELCGSDHVNEVASADDVHPNPAGFYVRSLRELLSESDPRVILTTSDAFYLCTQPTATPDMETSKALVPMRERTVKYLFVPVTRSLTGSSS